MRALELTDYLGAHPGVHHGEEGVHFAVWAPNAQSVAVVGDFNSWNTQAHPMQASAEHSGVWTVFAPSARAGSLYRYALKDRHGCALPWKADPWARESERSPGTASVVSCAAHHYVWGDQQWMAQRTECQQRDAPLSIYEVHLGSWMDERPGMGLWSSVGPRLIQYVKAMGFTHIELLPVMMHPFGGSWGYQPLGLFAPSARYGSPLEFAAFVDACHQEGIGVILDWVPAHFPDDDWGLARFDGTALYEHEDPRQGVHPDWDSLIYNFGRTEVCDFLIASALYWLRHYHVDGLRVDAVASMLYLDYSRPAGQWIPNRHGGRENLEAIAFLQRLNTAIRTSYPDTLLIAEESTAWPGVTAAVEDGGLGFDYKWNMGWMHDSLRYMAYDPIYRAHHHNDITFGLVYAWSERFILPLSHDEVVHGKGSLLHKMPGDEWQQFANLRAYYGLMWAHPGRKLLFMGNEIAQRKEWDHDDVIDWDALAHSSHAGVQRLVCDLNTLYRHSAALHDGEDDPQSFAWIVRDDVGQSVFAFCRRHRLGEILVVCNMTPVARHEYRLGAPRAGRWQERLNTDALCYGGSGVGNEGEAWTRPQSSHGMAQSLCLILPPLSTLFFEWKEAA